MPIKIILGLLLVYPMALVTQNFLDFELGDGLFMDTVVYGSKQQLLEVILRDWLLSAPWIFLIVLLSLVFFNFIKRKHAILLFIPIFLGLFGLVFFGLLPQMPTFVLLYGISLPLIFRLGRAA